jgi:probable F420-dependent oxidoreductase
MKIGITLPIEPFQSRGFVDLVRRAGELGYQEVWSLEANSTDAFSPLAAIAMINQTMRLGTAIVPVFTRPPALIAMSAMTVQQLCGGRFVLGLGISSPQIVGQWMGVPFERPLTRMRESVGAIRAALGGEKVAVEGQTLSVNGFRLDLEADSPPPPIFLAIQSARMCRLAGELADGLLTNFITPRALPQMLRQVEEGARRAGRKAPREVVCRILTIVDEEPERVSRAMRRHITPYLITPGYNRFFSEIGFEREADKALRAWTAGDRKGATEVIGDAMLNDIYLLGSVEHCRERLAAFAEAGVTTMALWFVSLAQNEQERKANILAAMEKLAPR